MRNKVYKRENAIYPMYCFYDKKQTEYGVPFAQVNDETAKRYFQMMLHNGDPAMRFAPADFDLYIVGEYNASTGDFISSKPEFIVNGLEVYDESK